MTRDRFWVINDVHQGRLRGELRFNRGRLRGELRFNRGRLSFIRGILRIIKVSLAIPRQHSSTG